MLSRTLACVLLAAGLSLQAATADQPVNAEAHRNYSKKNPLFDIRNLDTPPQGITQQPPNLTPELIALNKTANVLVEFIITNDGDVALPYVTKTSDARFNEVTLGAIRQWKFKPGVKKGKAVHTRVSQLLTFNQIP